jgi:signal transduction histidine kinase
MESEPRTPNNVAGPDRHTVAKWVRPSSLRGRLLLFVALITASVVGAVSYLEVRSFALTIDRERSMTARLTAQAVAEDLDGRSAPLDPLDVRDTLHDFAEADVVIRSISVVRAAEGGELEVFASTSSAERVEGLDLAGRAIDSRQATDDRTPLLVSVATPLENSPSAAVVVAVSLAGVQQAREQGRTVALGFALPTILLVTLLVDLTARQLVHRPIAEIRATMARAAGGALSARAPITRNDELGSVAAGLNDMLERVEHFSDELRERVRDATEQLRQRNLELAENYSQMLTLRETLARTERMAALGHMAANVAHQVGTPLNLVSGYVQMIRDDPDTSAAVRQRLNTVDAQIQQVTRVVRAMLDQARQPPHREKTRLAVLIGRVCDLIAPRLARSGVQVVMSVPDDLPPIEADAVQLELAVLNLVTNALDAMPTGGTLTLKGTAVDHLVRLEVRDTGPGIPESLIDRIFEPWVTTKPAGQGTGIGLGIVRDVVRAHGGVTSVRNARDGGAVFTIDLPRLGSTSLTLT